MGLRETLNQNEKIVTIATVVIIAIALLFVGGQLMCNGSAPGADGGAGNFFYTTDGKTFFTDDDSKIYPFDKDGAMAFKAVVYECPDGEQYIGYIEGYTKEARAQLEAAQGDPAQLGMMSMELDITGKVIARPEDINDMKKWVSVASPNASEIYRAAGDKCEGARPALPE